MERPEPTPAVAISPRLPSVEPFFIRCETCHARLRVRDERFLGEVQSCPKCGSMVHIIAPASLAAAAALPDATAEAAATPSLLARATTILREHSLVASVGAGTLLVAGGIIGFLTLGSSEQVATPPITNVAVVAQPPQQDEVAPVEEDQPVEETQPVEAKVDEQPAAQPAATEPELIKIAAVEAPAPADQASVSGPNLPIEQPAVPPQPARTLTLEPVATALKTAVVAEPAAEAAAYPPTIEVAAVEAEPKPLLPAPVTPPPRVTNFNDQLSVPIEKIDLPAIPIGEFVNLMSSMTAVPIKLDIKVLGEVGMSSRSTVTVRGENTTAGKLLAGVLKEHRLTCIERDGALVVVRAKP